MSDRPILFSGAMVRAILAGHKTQTRRIVRTIAGTSGVPLVPLPRQGSAIYLDQSGRGVGLEWAPYSGSGFQPWPADRIDEACPYGGPGDRLWVRETWRPMSWDRLAPTRGEEIEYAADRAVDDDTDGPRWRPSIFLPRWASRLTLEIRSVRVERLHAITEDDARAEGIDGQAAIPARINGKRGSVHCFGPDATRKAFALLWDGINGKRAPWASNPWVWCIGFSVATNRAREAVDG